MTRAHIASLSLVFLALIVTFDQVTTPPNPYHAPPALALGSGLIASGGFCGALPD